MRERDRRQEGPCRRAYREVFTAVSRARACDYFRDNKAEVFTILAVALSRSKGGALKRRSYMGQSASQAAGERGRIPSDSRRIGGHLRRIGKNAPRSDLRGTYVHDPIESHHHGSIFARFAARNCPFGDCAVPAATVGPRSGLET